MKLKKLVLSAIMVALAIVLDQLLVISIPPTSHPIMEISLGIIPIFIISYYCGIFYSAISAIIIDLLGYFIFGISKGYPFHPGFTLNALLGSLFFSIIFIFKDKLLSKKGTLVTCTSLSILSLVSLVIFNVYALSNIGIAFSVNGTSYNLSQAIITIINVLHILLSISVIVYIVITSKKADSNAITLSFILYHFIVTLFLTPLWVISYLSVPYLLLWITRLVICPIYIILYSLLSKAVLIPLKHLYKRLV